MSYRKQIAHALVLSAVTAFTATGCDMVMEEPVDGDLAGELLDVHSYTAEDAHAHGTDSRLSGDRQDAEIGNLAAPVSNGLYAIPYEPGVTVHVTNDHLSHSPADRIDMHGHGGGPYRIVAAAHGEVRFIEDSHNTNGGCENNNYVWLEHANGEWTKYSHIAQNSASVTAGLDVGDPVVAGQFLGIESDIGCASGDHLHFEVAVPDDLRDPINPVGGYIKGENRVPRICGISGNIFVAGAQYEVPDVRPGYGEYARNGVSDGDFQSIFDAASRCGYRLDWNDGFASNGTATFNPVFHPNSNPSVGWVSHRKLTAAQLTQKKADYSALDYELVFVDAYDVAGVVYYSAIFQRGATVPDTATYHGVSAASHQAIFDSWTGAGWRPRVISVASVDGVRTYAAIYTYGSIGSWQASSFQTSTDYQTNHTNNKNAGRRLIYLNSYVHSGSARYTAIWASSAAPSVFAQHGQTTATYQANWSALVGSGWFTGAVSGMYLAGQNYYASYWVK